MIKQITLSSVNIFDKDKDGKNLTYKAKDGITKRYKRIIIKSPDFEGSASGFIGSSSDPKNAWEPGMRVTVKLEYNGKYLNFGELSQIDLFESRIKDLEEKIKQIMGDNPFLDNAPKNEQDETLVKEEDIPEWE